MLTKWVVNLDGAWWLLEGDSLRCVDGLEAINEPVRVVTDFNGAVIDIETINGPGSYAAPLIEKRLREAGTLDGPGRVLVHASQRGGGTTRVLYSAVAAETYAEYFSQAAQRPDHCLLFSLVSALYRQAIAADDGAGAVVFRHGRQLELLVASGRDLVGTAHATAFSTREEDMEQAVSSLAKAFRKMTAELVEPPARMRWFSFAEVEDNLDALPGRMAALSGTPVDPAVADTLNTARGTVHTSLLELLAGLRSADAVNGVNSRVLYQAERAVPLVAGFLLAVSLALFGVAWHWSAQTEQMRSQIQAASREDAGMALQRMAASLPEAGKALYESSAVHKQLALLTRLDVALAAPDLRRIVRDIGDATPVGMRIVGISFATTATGGAIAIDGVVQKALRLAMGDVQQLTAALRARGYRISGGGAMDEHNSFRLTVNWEPDHDQI